VNRLGFGVIGAGVVGQMRARTIADSARATLLAVADVDEQRARAAAAGTGARVVREYGELLDMRDVEAVIVSVPAHLHEAAVLAALRAGKHVLCEKPLSINAASCRLLVKAAASARRTLAVGFNHRYYPCVTRLKQVLDEGAIGAVDHVRAFAGHQGLTEFRADWMYESAMSGGGAMMDIGIHVTDLVRFAVGDIVEVHGVCSNRIWQVPGSEDTAMAIMKTADGVPVRYHATWSEWKGYRLALEVYGERGMVGAYYAPMMNLIISRDRDSPRRRRRLLLHPWVNVREKLRGWQTTATLAFADELTDFHRLIEGEPSRIADGTAGCRAVEIAHAVYQSSVSGAAVRLPDPPVG